MADRWFARITCIKPKNKNEVEEEDLELQEEDVWGGYMTDSEDSKKKQEKKKKYVSFSWPPSQSPAAWGLASPKKKLTRSKSWDNESKKCTAEGSVAPVKIPDWSQIYKTEKRSVPDDEDYDGDDEMIPPHEYMAIRIARERLRRVSYSMLKGIGRTLKGRDLRTLRNAVFLKTGYLD